ncbi:MAG: hypothetical protein M3Q65_26595 [Chloroflexota bacterium]|nr:hypothetical protein [Chloroflexota bacterium]
MPRDRYPLHVVVHIPPPRLHRLVRVVPIGEMQEQHGVAVLALALEVYQAGFVTTFQIQAVGAGPDLGDADDAERSPRLALMATDDRGGHHTGQPYEGNGFGQGRDWQWRGAYRFSPTLDPAARKLRLVLAALTWARPDQVRRRVVPTPTVIGPWAFTVTL